MTNFVENWMTAHAIRGDCCQGGVVRFFDDQSTKLKRIPSLIAEIQQALPNTYNDCAEAPMV